MTKRPKVFANKIDKMIKNNREVFDSSVEEFKKLKKDNMDDNLNISDKITCLLNRDGYIFNVDVLIVTKDNEYKTHIASIVNNHIITLDNDIISIDDVIDIKY